MLKKHRHTLGGTVGASAAPESADLGTNGPSTYRQKTPAPMGRWRNFENQQKWFDDGDMISTMDYKINNYFPKIGLIMVNDTFYFNHGLYIYIYLKPDSDCK